MLILEPPFFFLLSVISIEVPGAPLLHCLTLLAIYSHGPGRIKAPGRIFALVSFNISVISPSDNFLVLWLLQIVIFVFWGYKNYHIYVLIPFGADSWFGTPFSVLDALNLKNIVYLISSITMLFNPFSVLESCGELKQKTKKHGLNF